MVTGTKWCTNGCCGPVLIDVFLPVVAVWEHRYIFFNAKIKSVKNINIGVYWMDLWWIKDWR